MPKVLPSGEYRAENANLAMSQFRDVNLSGSLFKDVNLKESCFDDVALTGARFSNVCLANAEVSDANLDGMTIEGILVTELLSVYRSQQTG